MAHTEGEKELVLGNKQLISLFFVIVALCGVFFALGYKVGEPSGKQLAAIPDTSTATPGTVSPIPAQPQDCVPERASARDSLCRCSARTSGGSNPINSKRRPRTMCSRLRLPRWLLRRPRPPAMRGQPTCRSQPWGCSDATNPRQDPQGTELPRAAGRELETGPVSWSWSGPIIKPRTSLTPRRA